MRHLYLLRHAKSLWANPAQRDFERPLSEKGLRDAVKVARFITRSKAEIELVLCSSAQRTLQTLDAIRPVLAPETEISVEDSLYVFDASGLLSRIGKVPPEIRSLLIVGHNPTIQNLAYHVTPNGPTREKISTKYPTAALTIAALENRTWDLSDPQCTKSVFVSPADLH